MTGSPYSPVPLPIGNSNACFIKSIKHNNHLVPVIFWWNVYWRCLPQRQRSFQTGHRSLCRHEHEEEVHLGTWKWSFPRTAPLSLVCTPGEYTVHRNKGQTHINYSRHFFTHRSRGNSLGTAVKSWGGRNKTRAHIRAPCTHSIINDMARS